MVDIYTLITREERVNPFSTVNHSWGRAVLVRHVRFDHERWTYENYRLYSGSESYGQSYMVNEAFVETFENFASFEAAREHRTNNGALKGIRFKHVTTKKADSLTNMGVVKVLWFEQNNTFPPAKKNVGLPCQQLVAFPLKDLHDDVHWPFAEGDYYGCSNAALSYHNILNLEAAPEPPARIIRRPASPLSRPDSVSSRPPSRPSSQLTARRGDNTSLD
jgi:hypothetical protein